MATTSKQSNATGGLLAELPVDRLREEAMEFGKALARKGASRIGDRLTGATGKVGGLSDLVPGPGDVVKAAAKAPVDSVKGAASKVKDALPGTGSDDSGASEDEGRAKKNQAHDGTNLKVTNIVETIDVPVGRDVAYELWTQFEEFPSFMKKVENVKQKKPEEVTWKAQIFWSHRTWTAKIVDQVPPERIVWKSEADKGKVDGAVTFHELAPDLTRVLVSLEYHPQGLFERTGNLWRAQGRRVRLEMRHFRRYVANHAIMKQDDVDGWEGEIHDGKVQRRRSSNGSAAKKSASSGSTAKKSSGGSAAKKSTSGSTAKKSASSGSTAKKSASSGTAKKTAAKKSSSSGSTAKKSTSASTARKSTSGSTAKKSTSGGSNARKSPAKKTASKRTAAAAKTAPRRTTASTSSAKASSAGTRKSTRKTARSSGTRSRS